MTYGSMIVWAAQGNPGCATFLAELAHLPGSNEPLAYVFNTIAKYPELRGSNAYMIWNDACDRDLHKAYKIFVAIYNGWLPMEVVRAHLAEGRCAPFKPEEYEGGAKA